MQNLYIKPDKTSNISSAHRPTPYIRRFLTESDPASVSVAFPNIYKPRISSYPPIETYSIPHRPVGTVPRCSPDVVQVSSISGHDEFALFFPNLGSCYLVRALNSQNEPQAQYIRGVAPPWNTFQVSLVVPFTGCCHVGPLYRRFPSVEPENEPQGEVHQRCCPALHHLSGVISGAHRQVRFRCGCCHVSSCINCCRSFSRVGQLSLHVEWE